VVDSRTYEHDHFEQSYVRNAGLDASIGKRCGMSSANCGSGCRFCATAA